MTVLYRSKILKNFDEDIVEKLVNFMKEQKISFLKGQISKLEKKGEKIHVTINGDIEEFDNVLLAVGRTPTTKNLGL